MTGPRLLLVGCGNMGFSMLQGWESLIEFPFNIEVVTPHQESLKEYQNSKKLTWLKNPDTLKPGPDLIIFAVKPYLLKEILPLYKKIIAANTMIVSIAAGKPLSFYKEYFSSDVPFIRAMPNTASTIGKGITLLYASSLSLAQKTIIDGVMSALGKNYWLDDEESFEKAAALTSCGPAYIFHMVEALAAAGHTLGLPETLASQMSRDLTIGSAEYLKESLQPPESLRQQVTSPKGMTEAALKVLMAPEGLRKIMTETIRAAYERSVEMGKESS